MICFRGRAGRPPSLSGTFLSTQHRTQSGASVVGPHLLPARTESVEPGECRSGRPSPASRGLLGGGEGKRKASCCLRGAARPGPSPPPAAFHTSYAAPAPPPARPVRKRGISWHQTRNRKAEMKTAPSQNRVGEGGQSLLSLSLLKAPPSPRAGKVLDVAQDGARVRLPPLPHAEEVLPALGKGRRIVLLAQTREWVGARSRGASRKESRAAWRAPPDFGARLRSHARLERAAPRLTFPLGSTMAVVKG